MHFNSRHRPTHFDYGQAYPNDEVLFDIDGFEVYDPFDSCASAQMLMYKE